MKRIFTIIIAGLISASMYAQAPEKMSYQAVVRDVSNSLVTSSAVGMQISILQGSSSGTAVYVETQTPTSNANGLVSVEIGGGTLVSGDFSAIDWGNGPYFVKTEIDPVGGSSYTIIGTSQFLSVPYALHAATADSIVGGGSITETDPIFGASIASGITALDTAYWNNHTIDTDTQLDSASIAALGFVANSGEHFYLGQDTLGGIVFYVYKGVNGEQRGLIVSKIDTTAKWQNALSFTGATSMWDGYTNTNLMINSPIKNWVTSNFSSDWYIPSINELQILFRNIYHVNKAITVGSLTPFPFGQQASTDYFWSSTEKIDELRYTGDENNAYIFGFPQELNYILGNNKNNERKVRAIRQF
jgi:hypothetical protein